MCQTLTKDKATRLNEVALRLIKSVQDVCENNRQVILHMAKEFSADYFVQLKHLKYHINVIEELHINENGHSRILCKLLQYTNGGHYVFLESFLDLIKTKNKKLKSGILHPFNIIAVLLHRIGRLVAVNNGFCLSGPVFQKPVSKESHHFGRHNVGYIGAFSG